MQFHCIGDCVSVQRETIRKNCSSFMNVFFVSEDRHAGTLLPVEVRASTSVRWIRRGTHCLKEIRCPPAALH
jgi:hypothetical protein